MSAQHAENDEVAGETFDAAASGASATVPTQASALRKGSHVVIKNHPCKIVEMSTSKTGKHGHAKVKLTALDIFTGKKYEDLCPSTHNMNCPHVLRRDYQVIDIDEEGFLTLMDEDNENRQDLKLEEFTKPNQIIEIKNMIEESGDMTIMATVIKALGIEGVVSFKKTS